MVLIASGLPEVTIDPNLIGYFLGLCGVYIGGRSYVKAIASKGANNVTPSS